MSALIKDCNISEKTLVWVVFMVNYVGLFEWVIINPLAPDYVVELGILTSQVGVIGGGYSIASALVGFLAVTFIDSHDRKKVLVYCILGMLLGSIATLLAFDFKTFFIAKAITGTFAGPAMAIGLAIISDNVPIERRGIAMGKALSAFPIVGAIGVPIGLELSNQTGSWRLAFIFNMVIMLWLLVFIVKKIPALDKHLHHLLPSSVVSKYKSVFHNRTYLLMYMTILLSNFAAFCLIPNFANYFIFNLDFPRAKLGLLYMIGGAVTYFAVRYMGKLADRYRAYLLMTCMVFVIVFALYFMFLSTHFQLPILAFFVLFMASMVSRNVVFSTLSSKVASHHDRAGFFAIYNVATNIGAGLGGWFSSFILKEGASLELINTDKLATITIVITLTLPFFVRRIERHVRLKAKREEASLRKL